MNIHHFVSIGSCAYGLYRQRYADVLILALFLGEITNIFYQPYVALGYYPKYKESSFKFGVMFMITFICIRGIGMFALAEFVQSHDNSLFLKVLFGVMWFLSLHWCFTIINKATKILGDKLNVSIMLRFYELLRNMRKNKKSMLMMYAIFSVVSTYRIFLHWNHREI